MSTTVVEVIELAHDGIKMKRKNATLFDQNTYMETELGKVQAVEGTMCGQLAGVECRKTVLKTAVGRFPIGTLKANG